MVSADCIVQPLGAMSRAGTIGLGRDGICADITIFGESVDRTARGGARFFGPAPRTAASAHEDTLPACPVQRARRRPAVHDDMRMRLEDKIRRLLRKFGIVLRKRVRGFS